MKEIRNVLIIGKDTQPMFRLMLRSIWGLPLHAMYSPLCCTTFFEAQKLLKEYTFDLVCIDDVVSAFSKEESPIFLFDSIKKSTSADAYILVQYADEAYFYESLLIFDVCEFPKHNVKKVNMHDITPDVRFNQYFDLVPIFFCFAGINDKIFGKNLWNFRGFFFDNKNHFRITKIIWE